MHALVTAADVPDREGGLLLLSTLFGQFPFLRKLFADSAYAGPVFANGIAEVMPNLVTEIVRRRNNAKGFVVEPQRWIVERSIGWLNRCRRLAKDWENRNHNALAFLHLASIRSCSESSVTLHEVSGRTHMGSSPSSRIYDFIANFSFWLRIRSLSPSSMRQTAPTSTHIRSGYHLPEP